MTFKEALKHWTKTINEWYGTGATEEEVKFVFIKHFCARKTYNGESYVDVFFKDRDGDWSQFLDTADREELDYLCRRLKGAQV